MALSEAVLAASSNNGISSTTSSFSISRAIGANKLGLLFTYEKYTGADPGSAPSISGGGLTWVQIASVVTKAASTGGRLSAYRAMGSSPSGTTISLTATGTLTDIGYYLVEVSGTPTGGTNGSAAIGATAASGDGSSTITSFTASLGTTPHADAFTYIAFCEMLNSITSITGLGTTDVSRAVGARWMVGGFDGTGGDGSASFTWSGARQAGSLCIEVLNGGIVVGGSITPTGTLGKKTLKGLAGSITPTGVMTYIKSQTVALAGSITPVGTLAKAMSKSFAGGVTPVGSLVTRYSHKMLVALASVVATITGRGTGSATLTPDTTTSLTITPEGTDAKTLTPEGDDSVTLTPEDTVEG